MYVRRFFALAASLTAFAGCAASPNPEAGEPPVAADPGDIEEAPASAPSAPSAPNAVLLKHADVHGVAHFTPGSDAPTPLELDSCDESDYAGVAWKEASYGDFLFRYLPGTAAERDLEAIAKIRIGLQADMERLLGVRNTGRITMVLSPNRLAAARAGYAFAMARPAKNQIEVVYLGVPDAVENRAPGHELAHIITSKIDGQWKIPLLTEGIAEYLNGSGQDLHADYVETLRAGIEADYATRFTDYDLRASNYERAGSFVKFLVERYGMAKFVELWKASTVAYPSYYWKLASGGDVVFTGRDMEKAMSTLSSKVYGVDFETLRGQWNDALKPYFAAPVKGLPPADYAEIQNVLGNVDASQSTGNATMFRTALDGYYCDWQNDVERAARSVATTEARGTIKTQIVSAWPARSRNFPTALVHAIRTEDRGGVVTTTTEEFWLERFPVGWRLSWMTGW